MYLYPPPPRFVKVVELPLLLRTLKPLALGVVVYVVVPRYPPLNLCAFASGVERVALPIANVSAITGATNDLKFIV